MVVRAAALALLLASPAAAQSAAPQAPPPERRGDVSVGYVFMHDSSSRSFNGVRLSAAGRVGQNLTIVGEYGYASHGGDLSLSSTGLHEYRTIDQTFFGGVRFVRGGTTAAVPFIQILAGPLRRSETLSHSSATSLAIRPDFGVDIAMGRTAAFRVNGGWTIVETSRRYRNQFSVSAGVTVLVGAR